MINCIIIEDEPLAQKGLTNLIKKFKNLSILSICDNIQDFHRYRDTNKDKTIDLLFLDIELPGQNGINFLRNAQLGIPVVLTTAYQQYAIEGYELSVLDYLLKPISIERFEQTVLKAENYIGFIRSNNKDKNDFIYVKSDKVIEKIFMDEIIFIEAMRNYVIYHCEKRKIICYNSLKNVEQSLPIKSFIKIQKSFIINKNKLEKIEKGTVLIHGKNIKIGRENKNEIIKQLLD